MLTAFLTLLEGRARKTSSGYPGGGWGWGCFDDFEGSWKGRGSVPCAAEDRGEQGYCAVAVGERECDVYSWWWEWKCTFEYPCTKVAFEWKFPRNRYLLTVIALSLYLVFLFLFPLSLFPLLWRTSLSYKISFLSFVCPYKSISFCNLTHPFQVSFFLHLF